MSFVTLDLFVAGAASMAVPVFIHLMSRQRRRPVEWAAVRFLIEALRPPGTGGAADGSTEIVNRCCSMGTMCSLETCSIGSCCGYHCP